MVLLLHSECVAVKSEISAMEVVGPCPEAAVFHSACILAEQVCAADVALLLLISKVYTV